jgi:hypothetical protein
MKSKPTSQVIKCQCGAQHTVVNQFAGAIICECGRDLVGPNAGKKAKSPLQPVRTKIKPPALLGPIADVPPPQERNGAVVVKPAKRVIFDNALVTELCNQYKEKEDFATYERICALTGDLIDSIIRVHRFQLSAPFEDIKNHMFGQFRGWIRGVKTAPGSPKVFTYFCVASKSMVTLANGDRLPINIIVDDRLPVSVRSWDAETGLFVNKKVVGWSKSPSINKHDWVSLHARQGASLVMTRGHEVQRFNGGKVSVSDLDPSDRLIICREEAVASAWSRSNVWNDSDTDWRYDITVEETHNYVANGIVVGNSSCVRNAALAYIGREKQFRDHMVTVHDTPLDAFVGTDYVQNFDTDIRDAILASLKELEVRWNEPHIREIIRYCVREVMTNAANTSRQQILKTIVSGYGMPLDSAKFLLDWTHAAIRNALLSIYDQPLGEIDIMRAAEKFSFIPDVIKCVGMDAAKRLMEVFAGITVRFPSHALMRRNSQLKEVFNVMTKDPSPETVNSLAKHLRTSPDSIQRQFEHVQGNVNDGLLTDTLLYEDDDVPIELSAETFAK